MYSITASGRAEFHEWMLAEITGGDYEVPALARTFFLGLLEPGDRATVAANIRQRIHEDLETLTQTEAQIAALEVPEEYTDVARYQQATLQYGLASARTALAWAEQFLP